MKKYLIDTQILIWSLISPSKLSQQIVDLMSSNSICASQISLLEIAIKQKLGKLPELTIAIDDLEQVLLKDGFDVIAIATKHIAHYNSIPLFADHRDPFDRFILATAYSEEIPIISSDANFRLYQGLIQLIEA